MIGDGALGVFDACHADDPVVPARVWRSYSAIDRSGYGYGAVSTRIGASIDAGATFDGGYLVNPSLDLQDGFSINYEVPALVYDSSASADERWKLIYWTVFNNPASTGDAWKRYDMTLSWLGMRSASSPMGPWSEPIKLMAGAIGNPAVGGAPRFVSDALVVAEPGPLPVSDGFYMAYQANTGPNAGDVRVRLCKLTANATVKQDCGEFFIATALASMRTFVPELRGMAALTAPCLFRKRGKTYLMVTPIDEAYNYRGLVVFEVADIATARLVKWFGVVPKVVKYLAAPTAFGGAGAYSEGTAEIVMGSVSPQMQFSLFNTGARIP